MRETRPLTKNETIFVSVMAPIFMTAWAIGMFSQLGHSDVLPLPFMILLGVLGAILLCLSLGLAFIAPFALLYFAGTVWKKKQSIFNRFNGACSSGTLFAQKACSSGSQLAKQTPIWKSGALFILLFLIAGIVWNVFK